MPCVTHTPRCTCCHNSRLWKSILCCVKVPLQRTTCPVMQQYVCVCIILCVWMCVAVIACLLLACHWEISRRLRRRHRYGIELLLAADWLRRHSRARLLACSSGCLCTCRFSCALQCHAVACNVITHTHTHCNVCGNCCNCSRRCLRCFFDWVNVSV